MKCLLPDNVTLISGYLVFLEIMAWSTQTLFLVIEDVKEEYHMFTSCSTKQGHPHYHGQDAKGKYMYLGKYSTLKKGSEDDIQEGLQFKDFPRRLQEFRAAYFHRKSGLKEDYALRWNDPVTGIEQVVCEDDISQEHKNEAKQKYFEEVSASAKEKWEDMSHVECTNTGGSLAQFQALALNKAMQKWKSKEMVAAWIVMLLEKNYVVFLIPVKFESYDEALYEELVSVGASNGHVNIGANIV